MYHQKTTQNAISAMSRLAELYSDSQAYASSHDIAKCRNLSQPLVAKILTELSRFGLITGSPGPGGGYRLACPPKEISLKDIVDLFEREMSDTCPYGPGWCGHHAPCPLHDSLQKMRESFHQYLKKTTLAVFESSKSKPTPSRESTKRPSR